MRRVTVEGRVARLMGFVDLSMNMIGFWEMPSDYIMCEMVDVEEKRKGMRGDEGG